MWFYRSSIGLLRIIEAADEKYYLLVGDDPTLWTMGYEDPESVSDAVLTHTTGCPAWDRSDATSAADLADWQMGQRM